MRQFVLIFILSLYLLPAGGLSIQAHFCGGHLETISLFGWQMQDCCCDDGEEEDSGCCKDLQTTFRFTDDQQASHPYRILSPHPVAILPLKHQEHFLHWNFHSQNLVRTPVFAKAQSPPHPNQYSQLLI